MASNLHVFSANLIKPPFFPISHLLFPFPLQSLPLSLNISPSLFLHRRGSRTYTTAQYSLGTSIRLYGDHDDDDDNEEYEHDAKDRSFEEAVELFNDMKYYDCHDLLETLWNEAQDPTRTLLHGVLQCAVGLHHLFNRNHRGAMMELGEGLCKLRKMNFRSGPFLQFEQDISSALHFLYQTQIELAACGDDICVAMDQSERSYQLLGGYAAGQQVYGLEREPQDELMYIVFRSPMSYGANNCRPQRVKLPMLTATNEHLLALKDK